jgi:3',5'-cyclic AMP phosphodiesterase CpdA
VAVRLVPGLCAAVLLCLASDSVAGKRLRKGPYLQNVAPTSVVVLWETSSAEAGTLRVIGPDVDRTIPLAAARRQEVVIDGLRPATRYSYEVTVDGHTEGGELATAPEEGSQAPFTFVVYGDTRSVLDNHRRVVARIRAEVPDFLLGTGDLVDEGGKENQWQQFFEIERELLRDNCLYPAVGNHDRQGRGRTADSWRTYFAVPENSPDPERYYAFTYGNSRVLVLDSNMHSFALTDQTAWLERQLQAARQDQKIRHIFVVMHHPPFSISLHGGHRDLRERWTPLYEKYGVDAVFSGHDHVYSRAENGGIRYFVSGGGGAPLYPRSPRASSIDKKSTKFFERVNHYLRIHVYGDLVEVTAIRADGTQIETTSWGTPPDPEAPAAADAPQGAAVAEAIRAPAPAIPTTAGAATVDRPARDRGIGLPLAIGMVGVVLVLGTGFALSRRRKR